MIEQLWYISQGSELLFVHNVPRYWQYWQDEVTLDWLAQMEYADRMAEGLVARRFLPPHVVALTFVIRQIAEHLKEVRCGALPRCLE